MEDSYNSTYQIGDRLIIELNTQQIFEGDYSDGGKNRIDLINCRQHNNRNELGGVYSFYRNEIINIYKYKSQVLDKQQKKNGIDFVDTNNIRIIEEEYNRLKLMCQNVIYLEQADDRYFKAIEKLSEAETVGVVSLGTDETNTDIIKNRKFHPELKNVLESEYVTKVMHGGSSLINILYRNYNVYVQNIFDTQIVDLILEKSKKGKCPSITKDISECLVNYLNFPPSLLKDALSLSKKHWTNRPLSEEKKLFASQLVTYLIPLKDHMKKKLLQGVYKAVEDVHNVYYNLDNYQFSHITHKNKVTDEISNLIPIISYNLNLKEENKTEDK